MEHINYNFLETLITDKGEKIGTVSKNQAVFMTFLRHFGCTFCREALAELSTKREEIERSGMKMVFVHMAENEEAESYFNRYNLEGVDHISDPECHLYEQFGLIKGSFRQLLGLKSWIRGFEAGVLKGHGIGKLVGDGFQMPGVFLIQNGKIVEHFIHKSSSDRPNYEKLMDCCRAA